MTELVPLSTEGWLYLARPALTVLVLTVTAIAWRADRRESRHLHAHEGGLSSDLIQGECPSAPPGSPPMPLAPGWYVEVLEPGVAHSIAKGMRIPVPGVLTLGRAPENAVVIEDPAISASHARISCDAQGCAVEDLASRNGTLVDEELVLAARPVVDGARVRLGDVVLRIRHIL